MCADKPKQRDLCAYVVWCIHTYACIYTYIYIYICVCV